MRAAAAVLALLLLAAAWPARAAADGEAGSTLGLRLEQVEAGSGWVWADFSLLHAIEGKTLDDLKHGRPLTFEYTVELWCERAHWFDALVASHSVEIRLRYDPWQELYAVAGLGPDIRKCLTPEEADEAVSQHLHFKVARLSALDPEKRYYFVLRADIKTLTLHDLNEVEGWLKGEVKPDAEHEQSMSIPRSLMRMFLGVSGLGDRSAMLRSEPFDGDRLGLGS